MLAPLPAGTVTAPDSAAHRDESSCVDLNTAWLGALGITGVGPAIAARIAADQSFAYVADLKSNSGLGAATVARILEQRLVGVDCVPSHEPPTCVSLNTVLVEDLRRIIDIDAGRAPLIEQVRPWQTVADLTRIDGIAEQRQVDIKVQVLARIVCDGTGPPPADDEPEGATPDTRASLDLAAPCRLDVLDGDADRWRLVAHRPADGLAAGDTSLGWITHRC